MFNQSQSPFEPDPTSQPTATRPAGQSQLHLLHPASNSAARLAATTANPWQARLEVKLRGRLAAAPRFGVIYDAADSPDGVELVFTTPNSTAKGFNSASSLGSQDDSSSSSGLQTVTVRCTGWQFARVSSRLTPRTRLAVEGKPLATLGANGEPKLEIVCTRLSIARPFAGVGQFGGSVRLGLVWASIFALIVLLEVLLPRLMPPGLLPLAILLGVMRLVEGATFLPEGVKAFVHRSSVKILVVAAFLLAVWLFVQYAYYTTFTVPARFR